MFVTKQAPLGGLEIFQCHYIISIVSWQLNNDCYAIKLQNTLKMAKSHSAKLVSLGQSGYEVGRVYIFMYLLEANTTSIRQELILSLPSLTIILLLLFYFPPFKFNILSALILEHMSVKETIIQNQRAYLINFY